MKNKHNLTEGNILKQLLLVSLPVMGTSLVQMAYNLTDLFWLGRVSSEAVSSSGFAGYFTWLGAAVILLVRIGTEVRVAQMTGANRHEQASGYAKTGVQLIFLLGLLYGALLFLFPEFWLQFFNIKDANVFDGAVVYLSIVSLGIVFYSLNPVLSASMIGTGNTLTPFIISASGLVVNMILDPLFILGFDWGIAGAAWATVIAQVVSTLIFLLYFKFRPSILSRVKLLTKVNMEKALDILRLGLPTAVQSAFFTFMAMWVSRIIVKVSGDQLAAVTAAQKIGSQFESLSWLIAGGISTALGAFVGQNVGAKQFNRVFKGIKYALWSMCVYGLMITLLLYVGAKGMYTLFIPTEPDTIKVGTSYLQILAYSQVFIIIEAIIGGAFNGFGKTLPQSVVSIVFNAARIPMAYALIPHFGLNGIWMAISLSSIFKGIVIWGWFKLVIKENELVESKPTLVVTP